MIRKLIKNILLKIIVTIGVLVVGIGVAYILNYSFVNDHLTQMQVLKQIYPVYLIMMGGALLVFFLRIFFGDKD